METWNREELYGEVWEKPLVKVALKYRISAVGLAKICRKLQIPLPGRGYWAKKEFGKPVEQLPLPEAKDLPPVYRFPQGALEPSAGAESTESTPTDPEFARITEIESRAIVVGLRAKRHKLATDTERILRNAITDHYGLLRTLRNQYCLHLRVSKTRLARALRLINAIVLSLEAEGFPVSFEKNGHGAVALIFGRSVSFAVVEKIREKSRRPAE